MLVAGVNGAGKSTFSQDPEVLAGLARDAEIAGPVDVINPDNETRRLLAENPEWDLARANKAAADLCEADVRRRIESGQGSFVIETVLSTDKYQAIVQRALEREWNVLFLYIALRTVEDSIARVAARVARGGHDVPEDRIRKRWPLSRRNIAWYWERASVSLLLQNPEIGAQWLIAERHFDGTTLIHEEDLWPESRELIEWINPPAAHT